MSREKKSHNRGKNGKGKGVKAEPQAQGEIPGEDAVQKRVMVPNPAGYAGKSLRARPRGKDWWPDVGRRVAPPLLFCNFILVYAFGSAI